MALSTLLAVEPVLSAAEQAAIDTWTTAALTRSGGVPYPPPGHAAALTHHALEGSPAPVRRAVDRVRIQSARLAAAAFGWPALTPGPVCIVRCAAPWTTSRAPAPERRPTPSAAVAVAGSVSLHFRGGARVPHRLGAGALAASAEPWDWSQEGTPATVLLMHTCPPGQADTDCPPCVELLRMLRA